MTDGRGRALVIYDVVRFDNPACRGMTELFAPKPGRKPEILLEAHRFVVTPPAYGATGPQDSTERPAQETA